MQPDSLKSRAQLGTFFKQLRTRVMPIRRDHDEANIFPHSCLEHGLQRRRTPVSLQQEKQTTTRKLILQCVFGF